MLKMELAYINEYSVFKIEVTKRDKARLLNLFVGLYNLYIWHVNDTLLIFTIGCLNIGVYVFGKK